MLVGNRSFIIQEVAIKGNEFNSDGLPKRYNYFNIYSQNYLEFLLKNNKRIKSYKLIKDTNFKAKNISQSISDHDNAYDITTMLGKWQVNGYILQPWTFLIICLHE